MTLSNREALTVKVVTSPSNAKVETCVIEQLTAGLAQFGPGAWTLHAHRIRPVPPRITDQNLACKLEHGGPYNAKQCAPAGLGKKLTITASAKIDDPELAIAIDVGDATFKSCFRERMQKALRNVYSGLRTRPDGSLEPYFRIDANVHAEVTVEPTP